MLQGPRKVAPVLLAGFLLIVSLLICPRVSEALYSWPSTPSVTDPIYPTSGEPNPAGWDITGAWWAHSGGSYFFRMDLLGWPQNNSTYGFYFDIDTTGGGTVDGGGLTLTGIDLFDSVLFGSGSGFGAPTLTGWNGSAFVGATPVTPFNFAFSSGTEGGTSYFRLEWQIADANLGSAPFTWWAATANAGQLKDITASVLTPIPNAAWLFATGAVALFALRRRKALA